MEKKKINTEKKKKNNLPLIMALCGIIGTSCSVLALSQNFDIDKILGTSPKNDIIVNSDNLVNCNILPASNTSVSQAKNGDITVTTDGHVQVPLFYSSLEPVKSGDYSGSLSFKVDFESNGFVGIDLPIGNFSGNFRTVGLYIQRTDNNIRLVAMKGVHHNYDKYSLECFTDNTAIAYSDILESSGTIDVSFYWFRNSDNITYKVKINDKFIEWVDLVEESVDGMSIAFRIDKTLLYNNVSGNTSFGNGDIYLDVYNTQATIKDIKCNILN